LKRIIAQPWGGLGDNLQFSTLPELFTTLLGDDVWISSQNAVRNKGIYDLVWGQNPFVRGVTEEVPNVGSLDFGRLSPENGKDNLIIRWESLYFGTSRNRYPKIYYTPRCVTRFVDKVVVETCSHSVRFEYCQDRMLEHIMEVASLDNIVRIVHSHAPENMGEFPDCETFTPGDIFEFADILYSCRTFIGTESGASVLAATVKKEDANACIHVFCTDKHVRSRMFVFPNQKLIPFM
jgi:hypothetical protein